MTVQVLFPLFQKNVTQGYVSEDEAGRRLSMVVSKPDYAKSGTYWSWSNPPESEPYSNVLSDEASVRFSPFLSYRLLLLVADFSQPRLFSRGAVVSHSGAAASRMVFFRGSKFCSVMC